MQISLLKNGTEPIVLARCWATTVIVEESLKLTLETKTRDMGFGMAVVDMLAKLLTDYPDMLRCDWAIKLAETNATATKIAITSEGYAATSEVILKAGIRYQDTQLHGMSADMRPQPDVLNDITSGEGQGGQLAAASSTASSKIVRRKFLRSKKSVKDRATLADAVARAKAAIVCSNADAANKNACAAAALRHQLYEPFMHACQQVQQKKC